MKRPKVLILAPISHGFPPQGYGPWELIAYNIAEELAGMGEDVTVFATASATTKAKLRYYWDKPLEENEPGFESKVKIHIYEALRAAKDFDIVHNHLNIDPLLISGLCSTTIITTLHGAACEKDKEPLHRYLKNENFVSISFAERNFAPYLNWIGNVYNGVDFAKYKLSSGKGKYLVFSGRIAKDKGIEDAVKLSKITGIPLKIAGIITDKKYFEAKVKPFIDNRLIEYVGNLSYEPYAKLLRDAKALLFLIHWNEPFGLSALDAVATGIPVIGYKKGALPEIIYDDRMGNVGNDFEEVVKMISKDLTFKPHTIKDLAKAKFDRKIMAEGYSKIYRKILTR